VSIRENPRPLFFSVISVFSVVNWIVGCVRRSLKVAFLDEVSMTNDFYSFVGHKQLAFMNPMPESVYEHVMGVLNQPRGGTVADFGSGFGELSLRLIERFGVHADCVELSPLMAGVARERAAARVPTELIRIHEGDAGAFKATIPAESFDLTICIGSSHALGGYGQMLQVLSRLTRAGGHVLVGEGYWKSPPARGYLDATGILIDEFGTFADLIDHGASLNLACQFATSASAEDFDRYEWAHARSLEAHARQHLSDPVAKAMLARSRAWRDAYIRWGRECLGFGLVLFRK
jgi:SAM-dependent methyltransferase